MHEGLQLDPDGLRHQAAQLADLGERVGQTYTGLRDAMVQAEGCWGDDYLGEAFATDFKPQADQLLANLRAMAESLYGTAGEVADAAHQFESQDQGSADQMHRMAGEWADPPLDSAVGTYPSAGAGAGAAPGLVGVPPMTANRTHPTEQPPSVGWQTPDASEERSTPQGGPQRLDPSAEASRRDTARPAEAGRSHGETPAEAPGRRSPATSVSPSGVTPNAPRTPAASNQGARPSVSTGSTGSPWSGRTPTVPSAPAATASNPSNPRFGSPPRTQKPTAAPKGGRDRNRSAQPPISGSDASVLLRWLAQMLAERHGVEVVGFDLPGLAESVVHEFAAAIDRVLTEYPVIALDVVEVADLDEGADRVRWSSEARGEPTGEATRSIILDRRTACAPSRVVRTPEPAADPGDLEIYAATVRELGLALDAVGGGVARKQAQRALIAAYLRLEQGPHDTLAATVRGYRRWRAAGLSGLIGGFDMSRALGGAFADVVLHGDKASVAARALHAVLVAAAPQPG